MAQIEIRGKAENEIQTRNRILRNQLKDRDNCIVLKIDTHMQRDEVSPFGFHFELDKKKYQARKKAIRRKKVFKWLAWIAYYHHKFGIRHLLLVLLLAAFVFIGGAIFLALEAPNEMQDLTETIMLMNRIFTEETNDVINIALNYTGEIRESKMKRTLKAYYKDLLDAEGRFHGSVWHKAENLDLNLMWYYSSSTFYCMTLFSTIGYGTIAPQTAAGRALSIVYASVGIPLMLVVLGDIGEGFQNVLTKIYIFFLLKYKKLRKQEPPEDLEDIVLPIWLALSIVAIYLGLCTLFITLFDHSEGKMPGIDSASAFYFTFISLTTIGLGDVMPYNIQYSPILAAVFLLGLALISIVNTSIYAQCYDGFFNFLEFMEAKLEVIHRSTHKPHGHKVFQDLEPCILLLVCSFPHLGAEMRNGALEGILKPAGTETKESKGNKKVTYSAVVRKRTISYSGEPDGAEQKTKSSGRMRAPTLGALGGRDLAKFRKQRQMARRNSDASKSAGAASKVVRRGSDASSIPPNLDEWKKQITKRDKPKEETKPDPPKPEEVKPVEPPKKEEPKKPDTVIVVPPAAGSSKDPFDMSDLYGDAPFTPIAPEAPEDEPDEVPMVPPIVVHTEDETRSLESEEEDEGPPGGSRPPPLISLPIPQKDDSDDDDDDDDDWQPPTSKFANLKRGSVFVPKGTLADDSDDGTEGPSVEYIP